MPGDDGMTVDERRRYLQRMHGRYWAQDRKGRSRLLDEMAQYTGMHRKSLIRLLRGDSLKRKPRKGGRGREYGADVEHAVRTVWETLDYVCAERLTAGLLSTAQQLSRFGELSLSPELEQKLGKISCSTVDRMIQHLPRRNWRLPRAGPEQANRVRAAVPMERLDWSLTEPGYFEVDLVHHSGESTASDYVHTLQMVDVATGWSERVALLGRSQYAVEQAFRRAQQRLPFAIKGLHPDNGGEFFNNHLVRIWGEEITGLRLTRSRPYHKNDNRFVEQKNDTLVRAYLGNYRLDTPEQVDRLNALYDQMWIYYNLFQPVFHLIDKPIVDGRLRRRWDTPATPFLRLCATTAVSVSDRQRLDASIAQTNPRALRRDIYHRLEHLWDEPVDARVSRRSA
jgi:hypothetical protein